MRHRRIYEQRIVYLHEKNRALTVKPILILFALTRAIIVWRQADAG